MSTIEISKAGNVMRDKVLKYELYIIASILLVLVFKYTKIPFSGTINLLVLSVIAIIYFFSAFQENKEENVTPTDQFFIKLCGISSSITIIGILFSSQKYPGDGNMWRIRAKCTTNSATKWSTHSALNWSIYSAAKCTV